MMIRIVLLDIIIALLLSLSSFKAQAIISRIYINFNSFHFTISTGDSKRKFECLIDIESQYSIGGKSQVLLPIKMNNSNTRIPQRKFTMKHCNEDYSIIEYQDTLHINIENNNTIVNISDFWYYYIDDNDSLFDIKDRNFAFGFRLDNEKHSITHRLLNQGLISKLQFSFYKLSSFNGLVIFGDIPLNYLKDNHFRHSCSIRNNSQGLWECEMSHVIIGNKEYIFINNFYDYQLHFTSLDTSLYVPKDFIIFLNKYYFKELIKKKKCSYDKESSQFNCNCDVIDKLPSISFILNKKEFIMNGLNLFYATKDYCMCLIHQSRSRNEWILGIDFFWNYLTTFDYENKEIVFYSKNPWKSYIELIKSCKNIIITLYSFIIILNLLGLLLIIVYTL